MGSTPAEGEDQTLLYYLVQCVTEYPRDGDRPHKEEGRQPSDDGFAPAEG